jgi:hypothetical protein
MLMFCLTVARTSRPLVDAWSVALLVDLEKGLHVLQAIGAAPSPLVDHAFQMVFKAVDAPNALTDQSTKGLTRALNGHDET